jgi:hypothetical protein
MRHPASHHNIAVQRLWRTGATQRCVWHSEASFLANLWQLGRDPPARPTIQQARQFQRLTPLDDEAGERPIRLLDRVEVAGGPYRGTDTRPPLGAQAPVTLR